MSGISGLVGSSTWAGPRGSTEDRRQEPRRLRDGVFRLSGLAVECPEGCVYPSRNFKLMIRGLVAA